MIHNYETPERMAATGRPNRFDYFESCFVCPWADCRFLHSWDCPLCKKEAAERKTKEVERVKVKKVSGHVARRGRPKKGDLRDVL